MRRLRMSASEGRASARPVRSANRAEERGRAEARPSAFCQLWKFTTRLRGDSLGEIQLETLLCRPLKQASQIGNGIGELDQSCHVVRRDGTPGGIELLKLVQFRFIS